MKHLRLRIVVPLVALALLATACSGTETASAPDVAASDNGASDTDAGDTDAETRTGDDTTTNADAGVETAVADDENLNPYEGLNEGEIESAKREEEVRQVIARAEAADAEAADAVETQPSETRETDTQSTDTQPEETQPSVPRFDADGTERLGDRVAGYDPKVFRDTRGRAITDRTPVHTDEGGQKHFVAEIYTPDGERKQGNERVYLDARAPLESETISRTWDFEAYTTIDGEEREHLYKYWNEPVPIRENLDIRLRANGFDVIQHIRLFGWEKTQDFPSPYGNFPKPSGDDKIYEPIPIDLPEGQTRWEASQFWYVYECQYALDRGGGVERHPPGEGSLRRFRVLEIGTEFPLPGLNGGEAWMKSGESGSGIVGVC